MYVPICFHNFAFACVVDLFYKPIHVFVGKGVDMGWSAPRRVWEDMTPPFPDKPWPQVDGQHLVDQARRWIGGPAEGNQDHKALRAGLRG